MAVDLCKHLRSKTLMSARWATEEEMVRTLAANDVPFSCRKTCQPWGPDEALAAPERCHGARTCFEHSPLNPARRGRSVS